MNVEMHLCKATKVGEFVYFRRLRLYANRLADDPLDEDLRKQRNPERIILFVCTHTCEVRI